MNVSHGPDPDKKISRVNNKESEVPRNLKIPEGIGVSPVIESGHEAFKQASRTNITGEELLDTLQNIEIDLNVIAICQRRIALDRGLLKPDEFIEIEQAADEDEPE